MSALDGLTEFLAARLDEDEAMAKRNIGGGSGWANGLGDSEDGGVTWPDYQTFDSDELTAACDYLDRFRPLRMLREVEDKRAIVADYLACAEAHRDGKGYPEVMRAARDAHHRDLMHLAAAWSDHPDYRQEWKP